MRSSKYYGPTTRETLMVFSSSDSKWRLNSLVNQVHMYTSDLIFIFGLLVHYLPIESPYNCISSWLMSSFSYFSDSWSSWLLKYTDHQMPFKNFHELESPLLSPYFKLVPEASLLARDSNVGEVQTWLRRGKWDHHDRCGWWRGLIGTTSKWWVATRVGRRQRHYHSEGKDR